MKIHNISLDTILNEKLFHLAIGNFDGIHLGHKTIISKLVKGAKNSKRPSAILSFNPHPRQFFAREFDRYQIISEINKVKKLKELGVDNFFSLTFDASIANLTPKEFIEKIIIQKMKVDKLIVGYDFRFGKDRKGDTLLLQDYSSIHGFSLEIINPIKEKKTKEIFSSTSIRTAINSGDISKANFFLGYNWRMEGVIIEGSKRARQINFPTANMIPHDQIYPLKGVYAIQSLFDGQLYNGIANFGERPTIEGKKILLETHLFDFNEDIYGKQLTVQFLTFIRKEKKFESFALLAEQIKKDTQTVRKYFKEK